MSAQRPRLLAHVAAALLLHAGALRVGPPSWAKESAASWSMTLRNVEDMQYLGEFSVGGQSISGIFDTGSFELLVFRKDCFTCGIAGKYSVDASKAYSQGSLSMVHAYGSGECTAADGFDTVSAGTLTAQHQAMWLASTCSMPVLDEAAFNAIVGIGPPGEPVLDALDTLQRLLDVAKEEDATNNETPAQLKELIVQTSQQLAAAKTKPSMLENFNVTTFSQCLGRDKGSPGVLVWNDETHEGEAETARLPVVGEIYWSVAVKGIALGSAGAQAMVCKEGCAAIIDTGTSLFAVPSTMYESIFSSVDDYMMTQLPPNTPQDCSDLSSFPDLVVNVGAELLRFPPSAYIGSFVGEATEEVARFIRTRHFRSGCQLLLMDLGPDEPTQHGLMIVLGMPFFREYYTTFDLGTNGLGNRSLFVSKAGDNCNRESKRALSVGQEHWAYEYAFQPRKVNASKLRPPPKRLHNGGRL